jgi:hypothetical protein
LLAHSQRRNFCHERRRHTGHVGTGAGLAEARRARRSRAARLSPG